MRREKKIIIFLCLLLCSFYLGCGGSAQSAGTGRIEMKEEAYAEAPAAEEFSITESGMAEPEEASYEGEQIRETERKLIKTVDLSLETENYDQLMTSLEEQINSIGGYIEYKDAYHGNLYSQYEKRANRNASLTVRIPSKRLEEFTGAVAEIGNITFESESVEDVTLQYVDLSSHKKMLQTQQERLLELLETAETMEDIIALESRLSEVRYEIESMESQLRTYDNLVDYSTVRLNIQEVERYSPQPKATIKERILQGLSENTYRVITGIVDFFVEVIIALPVLLLLAILLFLFVFAVRKIRRIRKKKEEMGEKVDEHHRLKSWPFRKKADKTENDR